MKPGCDDQSNGAVRVPGQIGDESFAALEPGCADRVRQCHRVFPLLPRSPHGAPTVVAGGPGILRTGFAQMVRKPQCSPAMATEETVSAFVLKIVTS